MRRMLFTAIGFLSIALATTSCETLQNLPTNTTGVFSLNGTWSLYASSEGNALEGSTVQVLPLSVNATLKTVANNTYCTREGDVIWKTIKSNGAGGFTLSNLSTACSGTTVYKDATLTVVNADQITITSRTATNSELVQDWRRVKQ